MPIETNQSTADTSPDICRFVREKTANGVDDLIVQVDEAEIRIGGQAGSYYVKQLATQAALAVSSGRAVRNDIDVMPH